MNFRIWRYELPLSAPVSLAPGMAMSVRDGLLLELVEGGRSFWGEASPLPGFSRESLEDVRKCLEEAAEPACMKWPRRGFDGVSASLSSAPPSVEFAVVSAFESFEGRGGERFVHSVPEPSIAVCGLLSGSRKEILADAAKLREDGYEAVKLKVGRGNVEEDAALVREVRDVLEDIVSLRLDANRAWSFDEAEDFARRIEAASIEFVEEPLEEPSRLRELSVATGLPVALDESLADMEPGEAKAHEYARAFVMKPTIVGCSRTLSLAAVARNFGAEAIISSSYESGVGMLGLLRMAAPFGRAAAGLDTYRRLADDVLDPPLDLSKPRLDVDGILGVRREVDYGKLERVA